MLPTWDIPITITQPYNDDDTKTNKKMKRKQAERKKKSYLLR
jgi:hypothetical protein